MRVASFGKENDTDLSDRERDRGIEMKRMHEVRVNDVTIYREKSICHDRVKLYLPLFYMVVYAQNLHLIRSI